MKKLTLAFAALMALSLGACSCTAEKKAVSDIQSTQQIVLPQYLNYVEKDASLNKDQKDDRKKLVESLQRLVEVLRKSLE